MRESRNTGPPDGSFDTLDQPSTEDPTQQHNARPKIQIEARGSSLSSFSRLPRSVIEQ